MEKKHIRHILVHPYPQAPERIRKQWCARAVLPTTVEYRQHALGGTNALDSAHFLNDWEKTPTGTILAVSGQMAEACVKRLLDTLAKHPRVKRGMVQVVVERDVTLQSQRGGLTRAVREINQKHNAEFKIVRRLK